MTKLHSTLFYHVYGELCLSRGNITHAGLHLSNQAFASQNLVTVD